MPRQSTRLANLTNLTTVYASYNAITSLTPLSGLPNLLALDVRGNAYTDITPLVNNAGIGSGDHVYVSLLASGACAAQAANLSALTTRGVNLTEDCP